MGKTYHIKHLPGGRNQGCSSILHRKKCSTRARVQITNYVGDVFRPVIRYACPTCQHRIEEDLIAQGYEKTDPPELRKS